MTAHDHDVLRRAVRLYRIPGVTAAEVCERLGISAYALKKARKSVDISDCSRTDDLVLSALTDTGKQTSGAWPCPAQLRTLASYLDYVNKDGSTPESVAAMLDDLVARDVLHQDGDTFRLLVPFP